MNEISTLRSLSLLTTLFVIALMVGVSVLF